VQQRAAMSERRFAAATERRKRRVARLVGAGDLSLIRQRGGRRRTILRQRSAASRPLLTLIAFARRGVRCLVKRTLILIRERQFPKLNFQHQCRSQAAATSGPCPGCVPRIRKCAARREKSKFASTQPAPQIFWLPLEKHLFCGISVSYSYVRALFCWCCSAIKTRAKVEPQ
jgi:hypothetical protein